MRTLFGLILLFLLAVGTSLGQTIFSPDYQGEESPQPLTRDSRINAVITGTMGTSTGEPAPSAYAGNPALRIPASPNGYGDTIRGTSPPPAIGVEDNGQIRASNIVARIRGEQQAAPSKKQPTQHKPKQ